ncbi:TPA: tail fiber protein [Salmonella enterica subsp. enterica serovar Muenchen]
MGKLTELEQWDEDVYQIETSDPVLGGPEGVSNRPQKQLANRTQWLKKRLEDANNALAEHEKSRNHPDATLTDRGFVKLYSGVTSMDETMAATPKAVKIAMDNANERLAKARNLADLQSIPLALANLTLTSVKVAVENAYLGAVSLPAQSVATDEAFTSIGSGYIRLWKNQTPGSPLPTDNWCYINIVGKRDANTGGVCVRAVEWNNPGNSWTGIRLNSNPGTAFTWARDFNTLNKPTPEDVGLAATKKAIDDTQIGLAAQGVMWISTADDLSNLPSGARRFASNKAPATVLPATGYFFLEVLAKRDLANGSCILATNDTRDVWIGFRYTVPDEAGFTWIQLNQNVQNLGLGETVDQAAGAMQKSQNGADIPDAALFRRNIGVYDASTSQKGLVRLSGGVSDADDTLAATSGAVKITYDAAQSAWRLAASKYTAEGATTGKAGLVQLVNSMGGSGSLVMPQAAVTTAIQTYPSLGKGQMLQDLRGSRSIDATYTNSTGFPIAVYVRISGGYSAVLYTYVNGIEFGGGGSTASNTSIATAFFIVPNGATYRVTATGASPALQMWSELR